MSEIVTAIKLVKMYAWEKSFAEKIHGNYVSKQYNQSFQFLVHVMFSIYYLHVAVLF